jgi:ketosteroid isomerase-like protein
MISFVLSTAFLAASVGKPVDVPDAVITVLRDYRAAMEALSIEKLAAVFDPDLFLFEGTHQNVSWADYRDNHIGPEMKDWSRFKVLETRIVDAVIGADIASVATVSTCLIVAAGKPLKISAAESFVLVRGEAGWKIRHLHYSGKRL